MKRIWLTIALFALASASTRAQDHQHDTGSLEDAHARMKELMGKVETRLKSIDELLTTHRRATRACPPPTRPRSTKSSS